MALCRVAGCDVKHPEGSIMCSRCWSRVPEDLRDRVRRAYLANLGSRKKQEQMGQMRMEGGLFPALEKKALEAAVAKDQGTFEWRDNESCENRIG